MYRQIITRNVAPSVRMSMRSSFSTSRIVMDKGPVEGAKDAVKQVDRTVSDTLVKGIEKGGEYNIPMPKLLVAWMSLFA